MNSTKKTARIAGLREAQRRESGSLYRGFPSVNGMFAIRPQHL
jgi:hypothetical protein